MSAGDIVAALQHVKSAQTWSRGSGRTSEQHSHRRTLAAAATLLLWAAALLPAPAAALNPFSVFAKKKEVSRCGHEHNEDEYSYATARIASVKAQVRRCCPVASGNRVAGRASQACSEAKQTCQACCRPCTPSAACLCYLELL